jgi:hypothetical protein
LQYEQLRAPINKIQIQKVILSSVARSSKFCLQLRDKTSPGYAFLMPAHQLITISSTWPYCYVSSSLPSPLLRPDILLVTLFFIIFCLFSPRNFCYITFKITECGLTPWSRILIQQLIVAQEVNKFSVFHHIVRKSSSLEPVICYFYPTGSHPFFKPRSKFTPCCQHAGRKIINLDSLFGCHCNLLNWC